MFIVCHKAINLGLVYSLLQYIIGDGILLSLTGSYGIDRNQLKQVDLASRLSNFYYAQLN